jgi:hypothetical protein
LHRFSSLSLFKMLPFFRCGVWKVAAGLFALVADAFGGGAGLAAAAPLGQMLAMCPFWLHLKHVFSAIGVLGALFDVAVAWEGVVGAA